MNLPLVLDIAVGLIFIYLILSLLASELQELLSTILQWRARHLKQSIDIMLAGGSEVESPERSRAIQLANELYNSPLINTLNQEYKPATQDEAGISNQNQSDKKVKIFGRRSSGPSYIPSETFAITLIETLKIPELIHRATVPRLETLKQKQLDYIESLLKSLNVDQKINEELTRELNYLGSGYDEVFQNFKNNKAALNASLSRMADKLDGYIATAESLLSDDDTSKLFLRKIKALKIDAFDTTNNSILLGGLQPSLPEVLEDLRHIRGYFKEIRKEIPDENSESYKRIKEVYGDIENVISEKAINNVPSSVISSLSILATRAQVKIENVETGLNQFQKEIETWFDRSMDRASGVYKRNAKGVALLMGLFVAIFTNTDSFHIVTRLSKDSELRNVITSRLSQVSQDSDSLGISKTEIRQIEKNLLDEVSLPLGWNPSNLDQQAREEWTIGKSYIPYVKRIFGWILSAIAIAMGAPFWFDLMSRVINVRNAGPKPISNTQDRPPSS